MCKSSLLCAVHLYRLQCILAIKISSIIIPQKMRYSCSTNPMATKFTFFMHQASHYGVSISNPAKQLLGQTPLKRSEFWLVKSHSNYKRGAEVFGSNRISTGTSAVLRKKPQPILLKVLTIHSDIWYIFHLPD